MNLRKLIFAGAAAAALAIVPSAALASNGPNPNTQSADNVHFTATYTETNVFGQPILFTCAGEHIDNSGQGGQVTEQENCVLSGPGLSNYVKGKYSGTFVSITNFQGTFPGFPGFTDFFWFSDFNGAIASSYTIQVAGGLNTLHLSATYPNA